MTATINDFSRLVTNCTDRNIPVYVNHAFNRYGISKFQFHPEGYITIELDNEPNNPKKTIATPDPQNVA